MFIYVRDNVVMTISTVRTAIAQAVRRQTLTAGGAA